MDSTGECVLVFGGGSWAASSCHGRVDSFRIRLPLYLRSRRFALSVPSTRDAQRVPANGAAQVADAGERQVVVCSLY
jgi:hypothetical protein